MKISIESIPDSIGKLTSLEEIIINNNKLINLPNSLIRLKNLKNIELLENNFEYLPDALLKYRPSSNLKRIIIDDKYNHLFEKEALYNWIVNHRCYDISPI